MPKISRNEIKKFLIKNPDWKVFSLEKIEKEFVFGNFKEAMRFVNKIAKLAEKMDHHPDIFIKYKKVRLVLSTHSLGGLSEKDLILANKIDKL